MKIPWKGGKGVNKDALPAELELGVWSDSLNVRFENGADSKFTGIASLSPDPSITAYSVIPQINVTTGSAVILFGTAQVYQNTGVANFEITKAVDAQAISSMTRIDATTTEVVTSAAHNLSNGNSIRVAGCTPTAHNTDESSVTVVNSTTFRYTPGSSTSAGAITAGSYVVLYGTVSNFSNATTIKWTGGKLGGRFYFQSLGGTLYEWEGTSAYRIHPLAITSYPAMAARVFQQWLVQVGGSSTAARRVRWCARVEPNTTSGISTFEAAATNDSGFVDKDDTPGIFIDLMPWGDTAYLFKDDEIYSMRFIGGNSVFKIDRLYDSSGLFWTGCVANAGDYGQIFLSKDLDIRIHRGGRSKSIAEGRVRNFLRNDIATGTNRHLAFLQANPNKPEVWVCYAQTGQSVCNRALVYNYAEDTWAIRSLPNVTAACAGITPGVLAGEVSPGDSTTRMLVATSGPKLGNVDSGTTDLGSTITATLERTGLHFDEPTLKKTLHKSNWTFDATAGNTFSIYHGYHIAPDAAATYGSAVTYTQGTTRDVCSFANSAEHAAIKLSTTATDMKLRSIQLHLNVDGEY